MIKIFHLQEHVPEYGSWSIAELADYWASISPAVEDTNTTVGAEDAFLEEYNEFKQQLDALPLGVVQIVNQKQVVKVQVN